MGICGVDQAASLDMLVLQNEVIHYVESVMRAVEVSADTLGLDVITEVGPGGTFIDQPHTAAHFRHELWFPKLLDRNYYQAWADNGARSTEDRCRLEKGNHPQKPTRPNQLRRSWPARSTTSLPLPTARCGKIIMSVKALYALRSMLNAQRTSDGTRFIRRSGSVSPASGDVQILDHPVVADFLSVRTAMRR